MSGILRMTVTVPDNRQLRQQIANSVVTHESIAITIDPQNRFIDGPIDMVVAVTVTRQTTPDRPLIVEGFTLDGRLVRLSVPALDSTEPAQIELTAP